MNPSLEYPLLSLSEHVQRFIPPSWYFWFNVSFHSDTPKDRPKFVHFLDSKPTRELFGREYDDFKSAIYSRFLKNTGTSQGRTSPFEHLPWIRGTVDSFLNNRVRNLKPDLHPLHHFLSLNEALVKARNLLMRQSGQSVLHIIYVAGLWLTVEDAMVESDY